MKRATCSILVGTTITGLVIFLLGIDIAGKRKHPLSASSLLVRDVNKKGSSPHISDMQILSLVDKRIQKLEDAFNNFINNTNEASKTKKSSITKKFIHIGDSKETISEKLKGNSSTEDPGKEKSSVEFVPFQPVAGKFILHKDEPIISESSQTPRFSSYKSGHEESSKYNSNDEKDSTGYMDSLIKNLHIDMIKLPTKNESSKEETSKKENNSKAEINSSADKNDIYKRELVSLSPKKVNNSSEDKDLIDQKLGNPSQKRNSDLNLEKSNNDKLKFNKTQKNKPTGFLTRAVDEALIPTDNIPNLTDFSSNGTSYHPIFFTKKNNLSEDKNLQDPISETSKPVISLPPLERVETNSLINSNKEANELEDLVKKPHITREDQKAIADAIDSLFSNDNEGIFNTSKKTNDKDIKFEDNKYVKSDNTQGLNNKSAVGSNKTNEFKSPVEEKTKRNLNNKDAIENSKEENKPLKNQEMENGENVPYELSKPIISLNSSSVLPSDEHKTIDLSVDNNKGKLPFVEEMEKSLSDLSKTTKLSNDPDLINKSSKTKVSNKSKGKKNKLPKLVKVKTNKISKKDSGKIDKVYDINPPSDSSAKSNKTLSSKSEVSNPVISETQTTLSENDLPTNLNIHDILNKEYYVLPKNENQLKEKNLGNIESVELKIIKTMVDDLKNDKTTEDLNQQKRDESTTEVTNKSPVEI